MGSLRNLDNSDGMILMQVVVSSVILLGVILAGFQAVQTTVRSANTSATTAEFKDLIMEIEQTLAVTEDCGPRLGILNKSLNLITGSLKPGFQVRVNDVAGAPLAMEEPTTILPGQAIGTRWNGKFKIKEVRLSPVAVRYGFPFAGIGSIGSFGGTQNLEHYLVTLSIVAERRFLFLGSTEMRSEIPLLVGVDAGKLIRSCSRKAVYSLALGPPGANPHSGLDCIDRGGTPIRYQDPVTFVQDSFFSCRVPVSAWGACNGDSNAGYSGPYTSFPGWHCYRATTGQRAGNANGVTYIY